MTPATLTAKTVDDDVAAIREALAEGGVPHGPWFEHHDKGRLYIENQSDDVVCDMGLRAKCSPKSRYIAACSPDRLERILTALTAAQAQARAETVEWQPIETAPRDGSTIIVGRDMGDFGFVRGYSRWEGGNGFVGGWVSRGFDEFQGDLGLAHPTLWQPLPPPPAIDSAIGGKGA